MYVCMYMCMYVFLSVCMHVCIRVCMYVCVYVCIFLCVCMCVCVCVCMYVGRCVCMHVCMDEWMQFIIKKQKSTPHQQKQTRNKTKQKTITVKQNNDHQTKINQQYCTDGGSIPERIASETPYIFVRNVKKYIFRSTRSTRSHVEIAWGQSMGLIFQKKKEKKKKKRKQNTWELTPVCVAFLRLIPINSRQNVKLVVCFLIPRELPSPR